MKNLLKEFWYGNISPFEQFYPNTQEMKELSGFIARHYDDLVERLPEKEKEILEKYNENVLELESLTNEGSALGPHPFPMMVRDFQFCIGEESREQFLEMTGHLPDAVCACVGGGSNSAGSFAAYLADPVDLIGVEPLGRGTAVGDHAATLTYGEPGSMHGFHSYMLKNTDGEPAPVYSIASGLDYPSVGPEHALWKDLGRVNYVAVDDQDAVDAFFKLSRYEGIIPALESSHAIAYAMKWAAEHPCGSILATCSGRGDKDIDYVIEHYGFGENYRF